MEQIHEYMKPLREVEDELRSEGKHITNTLCEELDGGGVAKFATPVPKGANPNIKELIDRLQYATGNDRYYTMMNELTSLGVHPPCRFYRSRPNQPIMKITVRIISRQRNVDNSMFSLIYGFGWMEKLKP